MNEAASLIFACVTRKQGTIDWSAADERFQVLYTTLPDVVLASVRRANGPGSQEINAVIFDHSIGAQGYLEFLSEIACEFRGDVLMITGDGGGTLSTVSARDGRYVYRLDADDVRFYAAARFGIGEGESETESRACHAMTA